MSMESSLTALLKTICAQTFPDFAPAGTAAPWVTYQGIGGQSLRFVENTASLRHTLVQVNVWASSRAAALLLARQIEDAMCTASAFTASPSGEPISTAEQDMLPALYGCMQDFEVWSAR